MGVAEVYAPTVETHEIEQIRKQFKARQWPKWLESVQVSGLRGWTGQRVEYSFPVTAIVGENGAGKSLLLRASACAYEPLKDGAGFYPSDFFPDTRWDVSKDVTLEFSIRQGNGPESVRLWKRSERWSYPKRRPQRQVFFLDIARILPLDATIGYAKIARKNAAETSATELTSETRNRLSYILGRDYTGARFATTDLDATRRVGLLTARGTEYSQFHQGAGEDAMLDLLAQVEEIPNTSLLIIDEVEASLHPRAQRRLVRELLRQSRLKRLQVIVSTHSPYILEELPEEARILLLPSATGPSVVYGPSAEFALSRLDEDVHPDLYAFVEDREAGVMLREILASSAAGDDLIRVSRSRPWVRPTSYNCSGGWRRRDGCPTGARSVSSMATPKRGTAASPCPARKPPSVSCSRR